MIFVLKTHNNKNNKVRHYLLNGINRTERARPHILSEKVDCNSNIIECETDSSCKNNCIRFDDHRLICLEGICAYQRNNSLNVCQNNGQIASYFSFGRMMPACICPDEYIGLFCQTPNEMKRVESQTFEIKK